MHVGIDARVLGSGIGGGDTYIRNIVRVLGKINADARFTLFLLPSQRTDAIDGADSMRRIVVPPENLQIRIPFCLPVAALRSRVDLLHAHFLAPLWAPCPTVVQVHDISYERLRQHHPASYVVQYRAMMPLVLRRAAAIVTISEHSRQDIIRRYCVPDHRVVVTGCAADPTFAPVRDPARLTSVQAKYGTGNQYILSVGSLEPRKNIRSLVRAYTRLRMSDSVRHKLVLVGRKAWLYDEMFTEARHSGFSDDIVFTGYVPSADLVALYSGASTFVYPSLFEGFGLPPLEAMACGTPVITSNTSSLPEVVGDAGTMIDPTHVDALAIAMADMLTKPEFRARMACAGLERSRDFSWERAAQKLLGAYAMAVSRRDD